jgi:hypothetical protein
VVRGGRTPVSNAIDYVKFHSRSLDAVIRVYDEAGNVIETHEHAGDFSEGSKLFYAAEKSMRLFIACVAINESGLPGGEDSPS